jgi:hypothetical protein
MQQQALLQLQAAAAAADEAASIMSQLEADLQTLQPQQQKQNSKQDALRALQLLQRATAIRRQLLHPHNEMLGASCHQTAAAAVAALATAVASPGAAIAEAAAAAADVGSSLALLQRSLQVSSAADVCSLLRALECQLAELAQPGSCSCRECNDSSKAPAAAADEAAAYPAGHFTTKLSQQQQQQQQCQELLLVLQQHCTCRISFSGSFAEHKPRKEQQELLMMMLQHLQGSVLAAVSHQPPNALGTAAEQLIAVAAVAALLDGMRSCQHASKHDDAAGSIEPKIPAGVEQGAGTAEAAAEERNVRMVGRWCYRCSQLLRLAQDWLSHASHVVQLHLGLVCNYTS